MSEVGAAYDGMARSEPTARLARQEQIERELEQALLLLSGLHESDHMLDERAEAALLGGIDRVREARRLLARL